MNHAEQSGYKENDKIPVHFSICSAGQILGNDTQHHKLLNKTPEGIKKEDKNKIPGKRQICINAAIKNRYYTGNEH